MSWLSKAKNLDELKKLYHELAMRHHPDRGGDTEVMKEINGEYDRLYPAFQTLYNRTAAAPVQQSAAESRSEFYTQNGWAGDNYRSDRSTKEIAKILREYVKRVYPDHKFSVTTSYFSGGSSIRVALMSAPYEALLDGTKQRGLNDYYLEQDRGLSPQALRVMQDVNRLIKSYRYSDCDGMIDYFDTNFYYDLAIGKWNKPFEVNHRPAKVSAKKQSVSEVQDLSEADFFMDAEAERDEDLEL